jgi:hypothetical protein
MGAADGRSTWSLTTSPLCQQREEFCFFRLQMFARARRTDCVTLIGHVECIALGPACKPRARASVVRQRVPP